MEAPKFKQKRNGEMCLYWYGKELQLTHAQFMDFADVAVATQPENWSWFCKEDFDMEWYSKFYGTEQAFALRAKLAELGIYQI